MKPSGQVVLIVAFLIMVLLLILAFMVDGGRLYLLRGHAVRSAQAAADAGMSVAADRIVTQAVLRQTEAALFPCSTCTPTPDLSAAEKWLTEEDRLNLISPPLQTAVVQEALEWAARNGYEESSPEILKVEVIYPFDYRPAGDTLGLQVTIRRRVTILLAGLLDSDAVDFSVQARSEVRQR